MQPARDHVFPDCVQELGVPMHPRRCGPISGRFDRPARYRSAQKVPQPPEAPVYIRCHPHRHKRPVGDLLAIYQRVTRCQNIVHHHRPRGGQRRVHTRLQDQFHVHHSTRN